VSQRKLLRKPLTIAVGAIVLCSMLWPAAAQAQRHRVVRRAPVRTVAVGVGVFPAYYGYYRPWFYGAWSPFGYPYGWHPAYYGYPYGAFYADASVRVQVDPKETEVYIDGAWAGTVDDFDGFFQRLHLEPGDHEVELYLEGHRSQRQKIYLQPNGTFRIRHTMVPLGAGDTPDPRPVAQPRPQRADPYDAFGRPERRERSEPSERSERGSYGSLAIRVQPGDADILIDGESWEGPDRSDRLVVELPDGEHHIEIRKDGFATYTSSVRVRGGETTTLNISLARE
jgi:hypothetical protein